MKITRHIFLKTFAVILLAALGGAGIVFLLPQITEPSELIIRIAMLVTMGLAAGFFTRHLLRGHTGLYRLLAALLAVIVTLVVVNWRTAGAVGLDLFSPHPYPDWNGLIELAIPSIAAWLMVAAWPAKKIQVAAAEPATPVAAVAPPPEKHKPAKKIKAAQPKKAKAAAIAPAKASPASNQIGHQGMDHSIKSNSVRSNNGSSAPKPKIKRTAKPARKPTTRKAPILAAAPKSRIKTGVTSAEVKQQQKAAARSRRKRKDEQVRLVGEEQHRCPFCLEEIVPDDPRGVKICPICKTHHHADCWDVTGICQVPHHQN